VRGAKERGGVEKCERERKKPKKGRRLLLPLYEVASATPWGVMAKVASSSGRRGES